MPTAPRPSKCPDCGEPIGWAQVSREDTAISRVQVLQFSKGLTGPSGDDFDMPLVTDTNTGRISMRFVPGQDMMVRHDDICGRKRARVGR